LRNSHFSHEDDEYEAMKATEAKNYYALAHTVREDINDQASIMVNGRMKEYQVCAVYLYKTDRHIITDILMKVALNTISLTHISLCVKFCS
jgi:hypothetical protein